MGCRTAATIAALTAEIFFNVHNAMTEDGVVSKFQKQISFSVRPYHYFSPFLHLTSDYYGWKIAPHCAIPPLLDHDDRVHRRAYILPFSDWAYKLLTIKHVKMAFQNPRIVQKLPEKAYCNFSYRLPYVPLPFPFQVSIVPLNVDISNLCTEQKSPQPHVLSSYYLQSSSKVRYSSLSMQYYSTLNAGPL